MGRGRNEVVAKPRKIEGLPQTAIQVAVGTFHTLVLCEDGVYSFGSNDQTQCGFSLIQKVVSVPSNIFFCI